MDWFRVRFTSTLVDGEPIEGDHRRGRRLDGKGLFVVFDLARDPCPAPEDRRDAGDGAVPVGSVEEGDPGADRVDDDPRCEDAGAAAGFQITVVKTDTITT
jgi:hypothetical protein